MRRLVTLFTLFFLGMQAQAQMTLERSDFTLEPDTRVVYWYLDEEGVTIPESGEDLLWDYSGLSVGNGFFTDFDANMSDEFPESLFTSPTARNFLGGLARQDGTSYEILNNESYGRAGMVSEPIDIALGALTGGTEDTLRVFGKVYQFDPQETFIQFPLQYNDSWSYDHTITSDFQVSVEAFNLENVPAGQITRDSSVYEVSGYGTLLLPNPGGSGTISAEALMVKHTESLTYTYLLGGQPAPQLMLDLFGLQQSETSTFTRYSFYVKGLPAAAAEIVLDEEGNVSFFVIPDDIQDIISSTAEKAVESDAFRAFPNPLQAGQQLSVHVPVEVANGTIELLDAFGRPVASWSMNATQNETLRFALPKTLHSGMYFYRITDENKQVRGSGKLQVIH
ncbi:MAG: T9SS type A sorting domain-containing protein [Phaeodactylibacter sp.]|uniref:T9SS type A sorting domain-containing protein n=1 Tax=Phaeodactylibacter sp. TaxID=1940289 RepID=UPI0032EF1582